MERGGTRPPCRFCKKFASSDTERNPTVGRCQTLSAKNWKTLQRYYEHRACGGEVTDPIMRKNFGMIEHLLSQFDRDLQRAHLMAPM